MSKPWDPRLVQGRRAFGPAKRSRSRRSPSREWLPSLTTLALGFALVFAYRALPQPSPAPPDGGTAVEDVRAARVIDGDTLDYRGERIRIADINTPETSSPDCASEAALGAEATRRMEELIAAGPFTCSRRGTGGTRMPTVES